MNREELLGFLKESFYKEFFKGIEEELSKSPYSELYLFLIKEGKALSEDSERYKLDYDKYKTGVFLWWNEYPTLIKFFDILFEKKVNFQLPCYEKIKLVVKDYYDLINCIKEYNPKLFEEELNESIQLVFRKNINPINILKEKDHLINHINNEVEAYINKITPYFKEYFSKIEPIFKEYLESLNPIWEEYISTFTKNLMKVFSGKITPEDYSKEIGKDIENFERSTQNLKELFDSSIKKIQKHMEPRMQEILNHSKDIEPLIKLIERINIQDSTVIIHNYISLIKDIDSFNIHFTKFINRLYYILTKNNRNYKDRASCYFNITPKPYDPNTRKKLIQFILGKFKANYLRLSNFLLKAFGFNKIRKLEAHEIPDKIKFSEDKKITLIPQTGDEPDIQFDLENAKKFINSYCFFIDALGLY